MAKLEQTVHLALDELRMQMLGTQVLFGFQLQGAFQDQFATLSPLAKTLDAAALALMVFTLALLVAAPSQHRLVERGMASVRILNVANRFAEAALVSFALGLASDVYVVTESPWGVRAASAGAAAALVTAMLLWFGLGAGLRSFLPRRETEDALPADRHTDLHERINQMLTEARVILPGAQALLGFQFIVTLTRAFGELPPGDKAVHFGALAAVALAIMLLLTPAAIHRQTFGGRDVPRLHDIGSMLVSLALAPLGAGMTADFYLAAARMLGDRALATGAAAAVALLLGLLWYALPLALRARVQT